MVGLAVLVAAFSLGDAWVVARHLREDAQRTSQLFGRVFAGLSDPRSDAAVDALFDLAEQVRAFKIPIALTDAAGHVTAVDNMPSGAEADTARWIARLDAVTRPIVQPGVGTLHYGALPIARRLAVLALLQGVVLVGLAGLVLWAFRWRLAAARDRLWVAMARESAHQLGTPLMSLTGWIAYLRDNPAVSPAELADHLQADAERLERVAKRFERIGRPSRQEPVGLGTVAERVVTYFQPRLPTLASPVTLTLRAAGPGPSVLGDPVLLEWALEALVKNAVDALSGRGGRVEVRVDAAGRTGRLTVQDDGPGIPARIRAQLFEPGVTSKPGGWGMGLALARRIVEQQHGGRLAYHPAAAGATFSIELPLAPSP
ncbi:MAG: hypothetical protein AUH46_06870 [Gemmatimonadetes bacterium 13_1_40CM_70_15]|nr:MAG: hypothetical protein AUH46_06870 [Gemmatimonadetes bacterium 13_1_40CM_70_15]